MQLVSVVLPKESFPAVKDALFRAGITGITVARVPAHGPIGPAIDPGRGTIEIRFGQMIRIEAVVASAAVRGAVNAIRAGTAASGSAAAVEIVVRPVERAIRIRTGETNNSAILPHSGNAGPRHGLRLQ